MSRLYLPNQTTGPAVDRSNRFDSESRLHSSASSVFDFPISDPVIASHRTRDPTPLARQDLGQSTSRDHTSYLVISGGTGCNGILNAFGDQVTYVLPVSDNGGSSSEIIRVLGGPSIGDIRSRLIRLIPSSSPNSPTEAIRTLLSHRLPSHYTEREAREEWRGIVEGKSKLWYGIPTDRKETIRGFLVYFESELLRRAQKNFSFRNGSVGNYFLTAAHLFFRSVPSAIFLFSSITGSQAHILPVLVTNHTVTIAAELENGRTIVGQCEISHPVVTSVPALTQNEFTQEIGTTNLGYDDDNDGDEEDEKQLGSSNIMFAKADERDPAWLESKITRVFYINQYGQEIYPSPNHEFVKGLANRDVLVYSIGSLWTSIIPCLALRGVASAIAKSPTLRAKVLLLNGCNDRETTGYNAVDYVNSITRTLNNYDLKGRSQKNQDGFIAVNYPTSAFITHLVYLETTSIEVDEFALRALGVETIQVRKGHVRGDEAIYQAIDVQLALDSVLCS